VVKEPRQVDVVWQSLGIGAPASRALVNAGMTGLDELGPWTERDVLALHGMGPKAMGILKQAMADGGYSFSE
jgi:hypothetical protein